MQQTFQSPGAEPRYTVLNWPAGRLTGRQTDITTTIEIGFWKRSDAGPEWVCIDEIDAELCLADYGDDAEILSCFQGRAQITPKHPFWQFLKFPPMDRLLELAGAA